jgi:cobalt/nickel transport system ATP-binding protein
MGARMDHLMEFDKISFDYDGQTVLEEVSLSLRQGERVALTGPMGAGKTTLLKLALGLLKPSSGTIRMFGETLRSEKDFRGIRGRAGLLFQDSDDQLFCPTVLEDVAFGPLNMGRSVEEAEDDASEALLRVGLEGFERRITYRLSGGEKRLVALATILAMKPDILLLDEPSNGLDKTAYMRILELLPSLPQSILIVSHDKRLIDTVATRRIVLENARVNDCASPDSIGD